MKRTNIVLAAVLTGLAGPMVAQDPATSPQIPPQADPIERIVAKVRAAEDRLASVRLELSTTGQMPGGLEVSTKGELRVLRGAQPAVRSSLEFSFADGLTGRMESARTASGIVIFEDNPAFGELHLHLDATIVADLEWAGGVLSRSELPGMGDSRAVTPLGSAMLADLRRSFDLEVTGRTERGAESGQWLAGKRRAGLDQQDPESPLADRVEIFVRDRDQALVEVTHFLGGKRLQQIVVTRLDVDIDLPASTFVVDGRGQRLREVQQHLPMWDQIEQVLRQAEAKSVDGTVRPSRRK